LKHGIKRRGVAHVTLDERHGDTGNTFHPTQRLGHAIRKVIKNQRLLTRSQQFHQGMRADISGSAGHQKRLSHNTAAYPEKTSLSPNPQVASVFTFTRAISPKMPLA